MAGIRPRAAGRDRRAPATAAASSGASAARATATGGTGADLTGTGGTVATGVPATAIGAPAEPSSALDFDPKRTDDADVSTTTRSRARPRSSAVLRRTEYESGLRVVTEEMPGVRSV